MYVGSPCLLLNLFLLIAYVFLYGVKVSLYLMLLSTPLPYYNSQTYLILITLLR